MNQAFTPPREEHPFAPYVRILGKGKTGSRSLNRDEARTAFGMILAGEVEPLQLGAFLMLLRVKEETGEELAGFVDACRAALPQPPTGLSADLDWSSYAGKRHQHPWFVLSQLLLAQGGYRVLTHGSDGHTQGRLYTEQVYRALGLPVADDWNTVTTALADRSLCYFPLRALCPALHDIIQLRPLLGLRSPVNTLTRMLNPLGAPCSLQSIFHPAYAALHQEADRLLGQQFAAVFKGESGEVEIKPHAQVKVLCLTPDGTHEVQWPRHISERVPAVAEPAVEPLRQLWRGELDDAYGLRATIDTAATALLLLTDEREPARAMAQAEQLWQARDRDALDH